MALPFASIATGPARIDTLALKQANPIDDVVARYGIELRRQGRALVGRCPFHADGGRPNLHVFEATKSWFCFRCCQGGDVLKFVMLAENLGFRAAVEHLAGATLGPLRASPKQLSRPMPRASGGPDPEERAVLQAAV